LGEDHARRQRRQVRRRPLDVLALAVVVAVVVVVGRDLGACPLRIDCPGARLGRVSSRPAWDPACSSRVRA